jgi:queuine tRNA-ribosyltransferase
MVFKSKNRIYKYPMFFPDATRAVVRSVDSNDIKLTKTEGVLVNTLHLYLELGMDVFNKFNGIGNFMGWDGATISDSGGFQVMSIAKSGSINNPVSNLGVKFSLSKKKQVLLTPEKSIEYQMLLKTDLVVVLDDFTPKNATKTEAKETVKRTINWAKRSKKKFEEICERKELSGNERPYIVAVVQGGKYGDLRTECLEKLSEIGFDGYGYGGWPLRQTQGKLNEWEFDYESAQIIRDCSPNGSILYGLGIGKPNEIVNLVTMGYHIFDCVLPTRDARHGRLYIYNADSIDQIDVHGDNFFTFFTPTDKYKLDNSPVSTACDCLLCKKYSRAYLAHLFRIGDSGAHRLSTIHNLRFYSILMEKLKHIK